MKFALVDNEKVEAAKGLKGVCPICQESVIPKCGQYKINHWAHKSIAHCDKWWESETDWHRNWKNLFPKEWQEIVAYDEKTGEKHIADIKTSSDLVVEFQHSHISNEERISREEFYKNMVWVVDGTRRKRDFDKFCQNLNSFSLSYIPRTCLYVVKHGIYNIPREWQQSKVPVLFDFRDWLGLDQDDQRRKPLWCLLPTRKIDNSLLVFLVISREDFVDAVKKNALSIDYKLLMHGIKEAKLIPISIRKE
ncbi:MAG: hypothetical protein J6X07_04085 [Prevotella sp.]|nr:hypothetical protein [Prevotella sp.]